MEARKSHADRYPDVVREAKRLRRASPATGERRSFRDIAAMLADAGRLNSKGKPFGPSAVKAMVEGKQ